MRPNGLPPRQCPNLSLFGVYDGHGGDTIAHYVAKHFPAKLVATQQLTPNMSEDEVPQRARLAFEKAIMAIDAEMRMMPDVESGQDQSGSTSVMTLLSNGHIVCANTGDSRAVLSRAGEAVALSHDHKPYNPGEKERIEAAGSHVKFNRVNGDLAVSRALGDYVYKRCESIDPAEQAVTAFPEVITLARNPADEFIVLACDGIWDVMSSQEVVDKVRDMLENGRPPPPPPEETPSPEEGAPADPMEPLPQPECQWDLGAVAECLIDHCLRLGSRDNMSVIVVLLKPSLAPKPEPDGPPTAQPAAPVASASGQPTAAAAASHPPPSSPKLPV